MTENVKSEPKYVTVVFPPRKWSVKEAVAFEKFVEANAVEIRTVFIKYNIGTQHHG